MARDKGEVEHLTRLGANLTVMGEREIAHRMIERALRAHTSERPEESASKPAFAKLLL